MTLRTPADYECAELVGPQAAQHLIPVQVRQHQIENDQVIGLCKGLLKTCRTILRYIYVISRIAQMEMHELGDVRIIFNDKNF